MRSAQDYTFTDCVVIPAPLCASLLQYSNLLEIRRKSPEIDTIVTAMYLKAKEYVDRTSEVGRAKAPQTDIAGSLKWLTTNEIAGRLGITSRHVIRLIHTGKLDADSRGGRWWVSQPTFNDFRRSHEHLRAEPSGASSQDLE